MKKLINRTQNRLITVALIVVMTIVVVGCATSQVGTPSAFDGNTVNPNTSLTNPVD